MQGLIESRRGHGVALAVAVAFGVVQAARFSLAAGAGAGGPDAPTASPWQSFLPEALLGALAGLGGLFLFAWLLRNFGRWFGARADVREVRIALGWSLIPWLVLFLALFVLVQFLSADQLAPYYGGFFVAFLYGYVVLLLGLASALRISVLKTFFCLVVTVLFSFFPLTLAMQLLGFGPTPPSP